MEKKIADVIRTKTYRWAKRSLALREYWRKRQVRREDTFKLDNLEDRILLSADPSLGALPAILHDGYESEKAPIEMVDKTLQSQFALELLTKSSLSQGDTIVIDIADLEGGSSAFDAALTVGDDDIFKGSGALEIDLFNTGTVAPG